MYRAWIFLFIVGVVAAQVGEPRPAVLLTAGGDVRELLGVPGGTVPGSILASKVLAVAACGDNLILKFDQSIRWNNFEFEAPPGPAIVGFDSTCKMAAVYFPASSQVASIASGGIDVLPVQSSLIDGEVVAMGSPLRVLVRRDGEFHALQFRQIDGALEADNALGFNADFVGLLAAGSIVYATGTRLTVREPSGTERSLDLPLAVTGLIASGDAIVQVQTAGMSLALRIRADGIVLSYVPEVAQ